MERSYSLNLPYCAFRLFLFPHPPLKRTPPPRHEQESQDHHGKDSHPEIPPEHPAKLVRPHGHRSDPEDENNPVLEGVLLHACTYFPSFRINRLGITLSTSGNPRA